MDRKVFKRGFFVVLILVLSLATNWRVQAQGPNLTIFDFDPRNGDSVGQTVTIHIKWTCSPNCGEAQTTVSCGSGDQSNNTSGEFYYHWNTNGCQAGQQSVTVCVRINDDQQGIHASCPSKGYTLTGGNPNAPTVQFWPDDTNVVPDGGTTIHWRTTNATSVNIDGAVYGPSGDLYVHPIHSNRRFSIAATGPGGTTSASFEVTVTDVPQPAQPQPTSVPPQPTSAGNSGEEPGIGSDGKPFDRNVPFRPDIPSLAQARQYGTGGVEVSIYCAAMGKGVPTHDPDGSPNSAYSWFCPPDMPLTDFMKVCYNVWGNHYVSQNAMDANHIGGWRCVQLNTQSQPTVAPLPKDCSGVLPPHLQLGQQVVITANQLNLHSGDGLSQPIQGVLTIGDTAIVISGPICTDGYQWWQLQTQSQGTWWAAEGDGNRYWINGGNSQVIKTTATPTQNVQNQGSEQEDSAVIGCGDSAYNNTDGIVLVSLKEGTDGECGEFVINQFKAIQIDITSCVGNPPERLNEANLTADWPNNVIANHCQNKGWVVDSYPTDGAIVTWDNGCAFGYGKVAGTEGHAAIVIRTPSETGKDTILVDESNWVNSLGTPDHTRHTGKYAYPMEPCMHFIHVPGTKGAVDLDEDATSWFNQNIGSSQNTPPYTQGYSIAFPTAGSIPCINCSNSKGDWLQFNLPQNHYDINTVVLHFSFVNGLNNPPNGWSISVSLVPICIQPPQNACADSDLIEVKINPHMLDLLRSTKKISLTQMQDQLSWYITYKIK